MQKERRRRIAWPAISVLVVIGWAATLGSLAAGRTESPARNQSKGQNSSVEKTQTKVVLSTGTLAHIRTNWSSDAIVVGEGLSGGLWAGRGRRAAAAAEKHAATGIDESELPPHALAFDHTAGYPI
jgi:hypothetical protein